MTHIRVVFGRNSWKIFEERYVMKDELSKIEISDEFGVVLRCI